MNGRKKIGISGGTFDPIHNGHLAIAEHVRKSYGLDSIIFMPSGMPPHKDLSGVTEAEHRFNMVCKAVEGIPYFKVSRIELERNGYTYTVDTLEQLKAEYGTKVDFYFIIGADVVYDLLKWKNYSKLFTLCEFIAVMRPGFDADDFEHEIESLRKAHGAKINVIQAPLVDISSTAVRERAAKGYSINNCVPEAVENYIIENSLYRRLVK